MGETFKQLAESGPLLLAIGAAALAGLVSFLSPCVLPLMPGYLSYVTGLAGADLEGRTRAEAPRPDGDAPTGGDGAAGGTADGAAGGTADGAAGGTADGAAGGTADGAAGGTA
ncbi:cytochrome c biogenesis protein CcdA, partial [Micromonospora sp. NPDC000089]|uniref:cytochrome c biogenesis protein CcdA n=1 Tax=unclassified Micromonospora TaxID=2617518 RepID=UPI00368F416D